MAQVQLKGNADAAEFCPCEPYLNVLAAASYTLQEGEEPIRLGELYLLSAEKSGNDSLSLTQIYLLETSGVFDIKWRPWKYETITSPCLAQASADGTLRLHRLEENATQSSPEGLELHEISSVDVSSSMCLYVDWKPSACEPQVAVSQSDGGLSVIDVGQSEPEIVSSWDAHAYEAWIVAYDNWQPRIVYSGGDDSQFCCWDLRETQRPVFRDRRSHEMGVCTIQSSPLLENVLVTGSYDESIRLWDLRMIQKPMMQVALGLGGGVWRLKWHHADSRLLLAACMHNGFAVARVGDEKIEVLERYEEHKSLAYGGSWYGGDWEQTGPIEMRTRAEETQIASSMLNGLVIADERTDSHRQEEADETKALHTTAPSSTTSRGSTCLVATCSFYDKAVHIWEPKSLATGL